jgi:V8-like Glu-specific endopeptidase
VHPRRPARLAALAAALIATPFAIASPTHAVVGTPETGDSRAFTARLDIGDGQRICSAALVDPQWLLTAASCFVDNPVPGFETPRGKPDLKTTATIGRTDLTTQTGAVREVVDIVPRNERDLVLARLASPVTGIAPVPVSTTAPVAGEQLHVAGYGRTTDEWSPMELHTGTFTVDAVDTTNVDVTGQDGAAVCAGDTGGPTLRETNGTVELVAVNSRSWQAGCFGVDVTVTDTGAINSRVDDLGAWIDATTRTTHSSDFNRDGHADVATGIPTHIHNGRENSGAVAIVPGAAAGLDDPATLSFTQNSTVGGVAVPGSSEVGDEFAGATAWGDVNGDGYADLAIGSPGEDDTSGHTDIGAVTLLYGSATGFTADSRMYHAPTAARWDQEFCGTQLAIGDFNGDGKGDVAAFCPGNYSIMTIDGATKSVATKATSHWGAESEYYGITAADVDADGFDDVLATFRNSVGHPGNGTHLWAGSANGLGDRQIVRDRGDSLAAGDFNADGIADVAMGVGTSHSVHTAHGSPEGLPLQPGQEGDRYLLNWSTTIDLEDIGLTDDGEFDAVSVTAADVNGDGYDDVVAGIGDQDITVGDSVRSSAGAFCVLYGSAEGLTATGAALFSANTPGVEGAAEAGDRFGAAVAAADVTGDGYADLTVGDPGENDDNGAVIPFTSDGTGIIPTSGVYLGYGKLGTTSGRGVGQVLAH